MIRVWFNHWFSTSYRLIELMKQNSMQTVCEKADCTEQICAEKGFEEQVFVIGTNRQKNAVIQLVCDEWYEEPDLSGEEYVDFCINFCKEHEIDVFVPRREMVNISKNISRFSDAGVRVMVDSYDKMAFLNDKAKTYEFFKDSEKIHVPDFYIVNNVQGFKEAYQKLKQKYDDICIKFVKDEGGLSFRRITDDVDRFKSLKMYPGTKISYNDITLTLEEQKEFDDMMIMPYLSGEEVSVDCLNTTSGLIAVPRIKGTARHEYVSYIPEIIEMTKVIMDKIKLEFPCNVQFKYKDNILYLLEINTRMSGGLQMSCLMSQINIPNIALNKLLGREVSWHNECREGIVSYIELPKIIQ